MDHLKSKLEVVEALVASLPTNKSILTEDEDNRVVIPLDNSLPDRQTFRMCTGTKMTRNHIGMQGSKCSSGELYCKEKKEQKQ
ncbi:hypothetical protein TNCV_4063161 [Trichonephila clavipes]|nr:hypothetical protein TNCV_4063161 [Trichonephila clavipes]